MAANDSTPLVSALAVSLTLHIGMLTVLDGVWGGIAGAAKSVSAGRSGLLRVSLAAGPSGEAKPSASPPDDDAPTAPRTGLIELPGMHYFLPAELDNKPEPVGEVPLAYPADLPLVKRSHVVLTLLIDETGKVDKVIMETADAPEELAELASRAFSSTRFRPGFRDNQAVKSRLRIEVTFEGE